VSATDYRRFGSVR